MEEIVTIIIGLIMLIGGILIGRKINLKQTKTEKNNWRPIKGDSEKIEVYDNDTWKKYQLPKDEKGKQVKVNEVKEVAISNEGEMNVKIIKGATNRRNTTNNSDK